MSDIEVSQADRDAAAAFYGPHLARPNEVLVTAHMRAGKIDESPLIQAFARHRASEAERVREACAIEAERQFERSNHDDETDEGVVYSAGYEQGCYDSAAAIRSLPIGEGGTTKPTQG